METYHYIYPQVQVHKNYPEYENSINNYPSEYINYQSNTVDDNYPNHQMKSFYANKNILNYNSYIYNIQTANITNNYPSENYLINNEENNNGISNNINNNVKKTPADNIKRKHNLVYISSVSQKNNRISKIKTLENKDKIIISNNINNQGKQPQDNFKTISDETRLKLDDTIKNNSSIKLNTEEKNKNEKNNSEKINYLKTSENHLYEYNPVKYKKRNIINNINRFKKNNNFITINDAFQNKQIRNSFYPKETKFKIMNKSTNNLNKFKKNKIFFTNNFSTKKLKDKSESNFETLISQKKLKIFSSYKLLHAQSPKNSNNQIRKIKPEKIHSINKLPLSIKTMKLKNSYKRLNTPNIIRDFRKTSNKKLIEIKQSPKNQNNKKVKTNNNRNKKIVKKIVNPNINISLNAKKKFVSKINLNNKTINNNTYFKNRDSNSKEKIMNFSSNKIKKNIPKDRTLYTLKNENKVYNSAIIKNFLKNSHKFKNNNLIHLKVSINSDAHIDEKVDEKKNSKIGKKNYENIDEKSNLNISRKKNDEEIRRFLNETNPKLSLSKRRIFKSSGKERFNKTGVIINKKKNIYNFKKKIHKKHSFNKVSKDRLYMNNKSFKGFSSEKKLESIKKKYKFTPHNKESKKMVIEKNRADISELIGLSSIYLNTSAEAQYKLNLTEAFPKRELNIKIEEDFENNDSITNKNDNIKIAEKEDNIDENKEEDEEDLLNHKSFILDLNSIIPINEKQLKDTFNNQNKTKTNTRVKVKPKIADIN